MKPRDDYSMLFQWGDTGILSAADVYMTLSKLLSFLILFPRL